MAASSELRSRAPVADGTSRRALTIVALVVLVAGLAVGLSRLRPGARDLDRARQLVADEANFATATESGVTFTKVSTAIEDAAEDCRPAEATRCESLYAAAGYARVSAVAVLRCTRPGVFDARAAMRELVHELEDDAATATIPVVVTCR